MTFIAVTNKPDGERPHTTVVVPGENTERGAARLIDLPTTKQVTAQRPLGTIDARHRMVSVAEHLLVGRP